MNVFTAEEGALHFRHLAFGLWLAARFMLQSPFGKTHPQKGKG